MVEKDISKSRIRLFKKAYENLEFLESDYARPIRILSEFLEPVDRLQKENIKGVVVFFGSARTLPRKEALKNLKDIQKQVKDKEKIPKDLQEKLKIAKNSVLHSKYYEDAVKLAEKLSKWFKKNEKGGKRMAVCSGGGPGIMEAANKGAWQVGNDSVGLNIGLPFEQEPNKFQSDDISFIFHYFFIRKFWFSYLARALVVFPGGFGTLDEMFEIFTLAQTHKSHRSIPIILYGKEYWEKLINFQMFVDWNMVHKEDLALFKIYDTVNDSYEYLTDILSKKEKKFSVGEDPLGS
ncbi:LOG family protein [bacterium]